MKIALFTVAFAATLVLLHAAPAPQPAPEPEPEVGPQPAVRRDKRSHYAQPAYGSPCAAASAHLPPVYLASQPHSYGVPLNYGGAGYGYAAPHYRAHDDGLEDPAVFADMQRAGDEHMAMARTYGGYEAPAAAHLGGAAYGALAGPSGPALSVFPHANVGGCNVPLLLSCSPSIVRGRLVHTKPHYGYGGLAPGPLYRGVDEPLPGEEMQSFEPLRDSQNLHAANAQTQAEESQAAHIAHLAAHSAHLKQAEQAVQAAFANVAAANANKANAANNANAAKNHAMNQN